MTEPDPLTPEQRKFAEAATNTMLRLDSRVWTLIGTRGRWAVLEHEATGERAQIPVGDLIDLMTEMTEMTKSSDLTGCVYCGVAPATTRDHVPPQCLFPSPRPADLITVPCCEACRATQSKDDEYFKTMVVIRQDVAERPAARTLLDSVHRALRRHAARRFTSALAGTVREVELRTAAGLHVGRAIAYNADTRRLDAVVRRVLLGLYFHETNTRLPSTHEAKAFTASGLPVADPAAVESLQRLVEIALSGRVRSIGSDVFTYAWQRVQDDPDTSVWLFMFYGRVTFLGFTGPQEHFA